MVHPGLLWIESESAAVEEDGGFEVLLVSVSADSSFDGHNFAVDALGDGVRDAVFAVADNVSQPFFDRPRNLLHRFKLRVNHSVVPVPEVVRR